MTLHEEWRTFYGIVRRRWTSEEDGAPDFAGLPKKWRRAIEYAAWGERDKLADRRPGRILRIMKEKRDPQSPRHHRFFNCRCTMVPIIPDTAKSPD